MELAIIHKGEVLDVLDDLEGYDLDKPYARAEVVEAIQWEVRRIQRADGQPVENKGENNA